MSSYEAQLSGNEFEHGSSSSAQSESEEEGQIKEVVKTKSKKKETNKKRKHEERKEEKKGEKPSPGDPKKSKKNHEEKGSKKISFNDALANTEGEKEKTYSYKIMQNKNIMQTDLRANGTNWKKNHWFRIKEKMVFGIFDVDITNNNKNYQTVMAILRVC